MGIYEQDPDFFRWGLQLFDGDQSSNCGYCDTVTQNDTEYYHEQYFKEDYYGMGCDVVENDELLARALQEEFSQMSLADAPSSLCDEVAHSEVSYYPQQWLDQSAENYNFGQDIVHEDPDDTGMSSLCSTSVGSSLCEEECSSSLQLDEYAFDGEVGKRLNQMVSIPHVPKINGEIPSIDEATLDHQRLLDRLQLYELVELKVQGDGNCQFRSLSDQFYRTTEHHKFVRQEVVNQLKSCREMYEGYVPMAYGDYIKKMSKDGEWGDHVTLQAAADSYGVKIFVITSFKDTCYIEILPNFQRSNRVISLSFWAEVHYNSIYPEGDVPTFETEKKKRQWNFGEKHLELQDEYNLRE